MNCVVACKSFHLEYPPFPAPPSKNPARRSRQGKKELGWVHGITLEEMVKETPDPHPIWQQFGFPQISSP